MKQKEIDQLVKAINENAGNTSYMFIGLTDEEKSIVITRSEPSKIGEAIYSSIVANNNRKIAAELYSIIKDVMLNLFQTDDKYRRDFVKDLMSECLTNKKER